MICQEAMIQVAIIVALLTIRGFLVHLINQLLQLVLLLSNHSNTITFLVGAFYPGLQALLASQHIHSPPLKSSFSTLKPNQDIT